MSEIKHITDMENNNFKLTIVKVGGAVVEDEEMLDGVLDEFQKIQGMKILVHGGGRRATSVASRLGIETKMIEGRRVTDAAMLEVVTMVYGGLVAKHIVAKMNARGMKAISLTGADASIILAHRRSVRDGVDYGFVGDVDNVDAETIMALLRAGLVPVIDPLTHDGCGTMLNTNADTIASKVAMAMAQKADVTLVYAFEKQGVMRSGEDGESVIPTIDSRTFAALKEDGTVQGGMIPKIENALKAIEGGVEKVVITKADSISSPERGTVIS